VTLSVKLSWPLRVSRVSEPVVSVVMPVFDRAALLPGTLDNVLSQGETAFELVVVDDGSRDDSPKILEYWARKDARLRILYREHEGATAALTAGCAVARGRFIARHDVGDRSEPSRLRRQADLLRRDSKLAFVSCGHRVIAPRGEVIVEHPPAREPQDLSRASDPDWAYPHHGSVMFRRDAYSKVGGYRSQFYFAQDLDLWLRLLETGSLGYVPAVLYGVGYLHDGITTRYSREQATLVSLIRSLHASRRLGGDEAPWLERAGAVRPPAGRVTRSGRARSEYFIGSCLLERGDPRCRGYLLDAVRGNPAHLKAWLKLAISFISANGMKRGPSR